MGFIESWGRGIDKIIHESEKFNDITPHFRYDSGLWVEFDFKTSGKTSGKIIQLVLENPSVSIPEMASVIGVAERSIERNIQNMQKNDVLKRIGGAKGGHWIIIENEGNNG